MLLPTLRLLDARTIFVDPRPGAAVCRCRGFSLPGMMDFFLGLLSCVSFGLTARDLRRICVEDDHQPWLYVRLTGFATVTFAPFFLPTPWNRAAVLAGAAAVVLATFLVKRAWP